MNRFLFQRVWNMQVTGGSGNGRYIWGRLLMDSPGEIGFSADDFYKDTTVGTPVGTQKGWYWFGGYPTNPYANFYFGISTIPEPASLVLLALGALTLIRRR